MQPLKHEVKVSITLYNGYPTLQTGALECCMLVIGRMVVPTRADLLYGLSSVRCNKKPLVCVFIYHVDSPI